MFLLALLNISRGECDRPCYQSIGLLSTVWEVMKVQFVSFQLPLLIEEALRHPKLLQACSDVCITKTEVAKYGVSHVGTCGPCGQCPAAFSYWIECERRWSGVIGPHNTTLSISRSMVHVIESLTVWCKLTPKISEFLGRVVGMKLKPQLVYLTMTAAFLSWLLPLFSPIHSDIQFSNVA